MQNVVGTEMLSENQDKRPLSTLRHDLLEESRQSVMESILLDE